MVSTVKLPILKKGEYTLWSMRMEQYLTNTDYSLWQVILNGDGPIQVTTNENGVETKSLWAAIKNRFGGNIESTKMQKNVLKQQFENFSVSDTEGLDKAYDRFQKLISLLEVNGASISNEDANRNFLRPLPSSWNNVALIMRNKDVNVAKGLLKADVFMKAGINMFESTKKQQVQGIIFGSNDNFLLMAKNAISLAVLYGACSYHILKLWLALKTTCSCLIDGDDDLTNLAKFSTDGIDDLDIDDLYNNLKVFKADIKGSSRSSSNSQNVAFLFAEDTSKSNDFNTANGVSTASGYNSQEQASLSSYTDDLMSRDNNRRTVTVEIFDALVIQDNALIVQDGLGYDWCYIAQDEPTEFAFIAYNENSSGSDTEVQSCSKNYVKAYEKLQKQFDEQRQTVSKANLEIVAYQLGIESVEAHGSELFNSIFDSRLSDRDDNQTNDRFKKDNRYHDVPPPLTGNYMPPLADLSFAGLDDSIYRPTTNKTSASQVELSLKIRNESVKPKQAEKPRIITQNPKGNPQQALKNKGIFDSGCSRHMTGNNDFLIDYQDVDGGFVAFGGSARGELKFNLFYVSQMCDKKNNVLFTKYECLVLSPNFKLLDASQVLLSVPKKSNMYSFDLKKVVPSGDLTCLFAKATIDESKLWHRRLGHVNFKTMNKLVKGSLERGLPSKIFENDQTCVACQKGKQHKASCKANLVSSISQPLQMLHMDLFGPTSVSSINHKTYCLLVTDDFSREMNEFCGLKGIKKEFSVARNQQQNRVAKRKDMTLIEAARTMLADSLLPTIFNIACYVLNRVLVTKPQNKTPYELIIGRPPSISFMRPFGCHVTILNTLDPLGKFDGRAEEGFLVGYSVNSKAFRVFNSQTKKVEENLHVNILENKPQRQVLENML
ncbi:putative ribonuclease H-like domain-containing protein [Tanacetum coccineum]